MTYVPSALDQKTFSFNDSSCYFHDAFADLDTLTSNAETQLKSIKFDSMVAIGLSGMLVLPVLARHFNVPFLALRKQSEHCHDRYGIGQYGRGTLGKRWILVDDFVASGKTIQTARNIVDDALATTGFHTTYVGTYCYGAYGLPGQFVFPDNSRSSIVKYVFDGKEHFIDGEFYKSFRADYRYNLLSGTVDPKGKAIKAYMESSYYRERFTLDEVSMMAIAIENDFKNKPRKDW